MSPLVSYVVSEGISLSPDEMTLMEQDTTPAAPLVYTPQAPKPQAAPKSEYVLVDDVTGKPPPKRGPQTIKVIRYVKDKEGKDVKQESQVRVPFAPKDNCKKCHSRGYIGFEATSGKLIPCRKCYPML